MLFSNRGSFCWTCCKNERLQKTEQQMICFEGYSGSSRQPLYQGVWHAGWRVNLNKFRASVLFATWKTRPFIFGSCLYKRWCLELSLCSWICASSSVLQKRKTHWMVVDKMKWISEFHTWLILWWLINIYRFSWSFCQSNVVHRAWFTSSPTLWEDQLLASRHRKRCRESCHNPERVGRQRCSQVYLYSSATWRSLE